MGTGMKGSEKQCIEKRNRKQDVCDWERNEDNSRRGKKVE